MVPTSDVFIVTHEVLISASLFHFKHTCMLSQVYMYDDKMLLNTRGHYTFTCLYTVVNCHSHFLNVIDKSQN